MCFWRSDKILIERAGGRRFDGRPARSLGGPRSCVGVSRESNIRYPLQEDGTVATEFQKMLSSVLLNFVVEPNFCTGRREDQRL